MSDADSQMVVVIPTFNERESLPELVSAVLHEVPASTVLVVDDNSPDGTGEWVARESERNSRLRLLSRNGKSGIGSATIAGLQMALRSGCQWIATMDADGSHAPTDLLAMWNLAIERSDNSSGKDHHPVVIGSRYVAGGGIECWSWRRKVLSRCVNLYSRMVLGLRTRDNTGAFRIYSREALSSIELGQINCRGYAYLEQILMHLKAAGCKFHEHPILFRNRHRGRSKVSVGVLVSNGLDLVRLGLRRK